MAMHVCFGSRHEHEILPALARRGERTLWTLPPQAGSEDTVVFYIKSPVASFVATGAVLDDERVDGAGYGFPGQMMGTVGRIAMLQDEVPLREARSATPGWGWLRQPHRNITVPPEHESSFAASLGSAKQPRALGGKTVPEVGGTAVLENIRRESTLLRRSRNRDLRDEVIRASQGKCAGCLTQYQRLEPRQWASLLQAHHKKPLHELDEPTVSRVDDLVALCPTCHVMAHLGQEGVRSVAQIRALNRRR